MTDSPQTAFPQPAAAKAWPDYRAVWRWHFYAGLFTLPFVIILSISGAIYLFKPQIEAWCERDYDNLLINGNLVSVSDQVQAALAAVPDSTPSGYELPLAPNSAVRVIVRTKGGEAIRVYLHPETLAILHTFPEKERFMRWLFRLHGELLMGDRGSNIVELAASWTIIMIVTGLYLWWPRQAKGWGGVAYPRLRNGSGIFWRDLHSVTGIWISTFALFLLLTGLPWAKFWGNYFKAIRRVTGTAVAQQDWTTGSESRAATLGRSEEQVTADATGKSARPTRDTSSGEHSGHGGGKRSGGRRGGSGVMPQDMTAFDRVAVTVSSLKLEHPVVVAPPASTDSDEWTAKSMTANRPYRVNLVVSGKTGEIVSREDFKDKHLIDKVVSTGIAAHEGQLFGWPNQLLGLLTAIGLVLLSVSGVIMWWRRRDQGVLGAPKVMLSPRLSFGLVVLVVLFGVYLPLFGASLVFVLLAEFAVLKRIPKVQDWLGLHISAASVVTEVPVPSE